MNPFQTKAFKKLKEKWYKKLEQDGFKDIEDLAKSEQPLKSYHSTCFQDQRVMVRFEMTEAYFYQAEHFLTNNKGNMTFLERQTWEAHSSGMSLREITEALKKEGIKTNKDSVNQTVTSLRAKMRNG